MPAIQYTPNAGFFGTDQVEYRVTNPDGGTHTAFLNITVNDTEAPVVVVSSPTEGQQLPSGTTQITVSGTATDNDSVASVEVRLDGGSWLLATGTASWSRLITGLVDGGSYLIEVRATDPAGNISTIVSRNISVATDAEIPTVVIVNPSAELAAGTTSTTVSGTAADNDSVALVEWRRDGGAWNTATGTDSWSFTLGSLTNGSSTLVEVRAQDATGNYSTIASRTVTVNNPPTAVDDSVTTDQDVTVDVDVLANDLNVDAGATLTIVVNGSDGTATVIP